MTRTRDRAGVVAVGLVVAALTGGCGTPVDPGFKVAEGVWVGGVLLENGVPVKARPNETVTILFSQGAAPNQVVVAGQTKPDDGTFTLGGPSRHQGLPPGKYTVRVEGSELEVDVRDRFAKQFENKKKPPLTAEVGPEEGQQFAIDLGKWTVEKKK